MPQTLRIGIIAPEYRPFVGGIPEVAEGLAKSLSAHAEVSLFTVPGSGVQNPPYRQQDYLTGDLSDDGHRLSTERIDVFLAMNGGLVPLVKYVEQPLFAYLHGNDFLDPWTRCGPQWLEAVPRPVLPPIRAYARRREIRKLIGLTSLVFTNSSQTARLIEERLGLAGENLSVLSPGVDDDFFQSRSNTRGSVLQLLTVANLRSTVPRKNVDGVIAAIRLLPPDLELRYTVVGGGDGLPRLEELAKTLGVGDRVTFLGRVDKEDLLRCYAESDLFLLASKASSKDVEGFGIVYLEASAAGVPVVCSAEGGAVDAVEEGVNGFVIEHSSPEDIAEGILRFVKDRDAYPAEQVRSVAEKYRWNQIAVRMLEAIESRI